MTRERGDDPPWPAALETALQGRYRLEGELGRGGMSTVFSARDTAWDRPAAVKVLHASLATAIGARRFLREIRIVTELSHPGIVPLWDWGDADGLLYYIMPRIEGESLRRRIADAGPLPLAEACRLACDAAEALAHAHAHAVIHRDVKPENILLAEGRAFVADFGLARVLGATESTRLTFTGDRLGTVQYMSPEQLRAEEALDQRTDVYGLGCVVFEMLTGEFAYTGPTLHELVRRILMAPVPSARVFRAEVPSAVDETVQRALAKSADERFATMDEFAAELRRGMAGAGHAD